MYRRSFFCDFLADPILNAYLLRLCPPIERAQPQDILGLCFPYQVRDGQVSPVVCTTVLVKTRAGTQFVPWHVIAQTHSHHDLKNFASASQCQNEHWSEGTHEIIHQMNKSHSSHSFALVLRPKIGILFDVDLRENNHDLTQNQIYRHSTIALGGTASASAHDIMTQVSDPQVLPFAHLCAPLYHQGEPLLPTTLTPA